ncbi:hypothetical protein SprV_0602102000 [Sparganum proliferum]
MRLTEDEVMVSFDVTSLLPSISQDLEDEMVSELFESQYDGTAKTIKRSHLLKFRLETYFTIEGAQRRRSSPAHRSLKGTPTYGLAKWLFRRLQFLTVESDTTVSSSAQFLEKLKGDLAIETIELLLQSKYDETENRLGRTYVLLLLKFCLRTYFTFDRTIYEQMKDTSMGSGHTFKFDEAEVLARGDNRVSRELLESWFTGRQSINKCNDLPIQYSVLKLRLGGDKCVVDASGPEYWGARTEDQALETLQNSLANQSRQRAAHRCSRLLFVNLVVEGEERSEAQFQESDYLRSFKPLICFIVLLLKKFVNGADGKEIWTRVLEEGFVVGFVFIGFRNDFNTGPHQRLLHKLSAIGIGGDLLNWEIWTRVLEEGFVVGFVFIGFRNDFNTGPHQRLLHKLSAIGIGGDLLNWVRYYSSIGARVTERPQTFTATNVTALATAVRLDEGMYSLEEISLWRISPRTGNTSQNLGRPDDYFVPEQKLTGLISFLLPQKCVRDDVDADEIGREVSE